MGDTVLYGGAGRGSFLRVTLELAEYALNQYGIRHEICSQKVSKITLAVGKESYTGIDLILQYAAQHGSKKPSAGWICQKVQLNLPDLVRGDVSLEERTEMQNHVISKCCKRCLRSLNAETVLYDLGKRARAQQN